MKTETTGVAYPYDWFNLEAERVGPIRAPRRIRLVLEEIKNINRDVLADNIPLFSHLIDCSLLSRENIDSTDMKEIFNGIIVDMEVIT